MVKIFLVAAAMIFGAIAVADLRASTPAPSAGSGCFELAPGDCLTFKRALPVGAD